jgi:hypothetical protein
MTSADTNDALEKKILIGIICNSCGDFCLVDFIQKRQLMSDCWLAWYAEFNRSSIVAHE